MPAVSVVIPTYNRADVLPRAIDSILSQSFSDFELIIVDDCSTDETPSVVKDYNDERITYIRFEENRGANAARNSGIRTAEADYISFLDSDDELKPEYLRTVLNELNKADPSCAGAFTAFEHVCNGSVVTISGAPDGIITQKQLIADNVIGGFSTVTMRATVFDNVGLLDEKMLSAQDIEYFIRVLEHYSMTGINQPLVTYHVDSDRISDDLNRRISGQERLIKKHGEKLSRAGRSRIFSSRAFAYARKGDLDAARQNFGQAIKENPFNGLAYYHYISTLFGQRAFDTLLDLKQQFKVLIYRLLSYR